MEHLASYGYVCISVQWGGVIEPAVDDVKAFTDSVFSWVLKGGFGLMEVISNQVVVIAHSNGGAFAPKAAESLKDLGSFELASVVLMSTVSAAVARYEFARSMLCIQVADDPDSHTNSAGRIVTSYEWAGGEHWGGYGGVCAEYGFTLNRFPKHLVFVSGASSVGTTDEVDDTNHYYQRNSFVRAYCLGFLELHLRKKMLYAKYFDTQRPIASVTAQEPDVQVAHMREDGGTRHILVDWKEKIPAFETAGADPAIISIPCDDQHSVNHGRALRLRYVRGESANVDIFLSIPPLAVKSISIGLCQTRDSSASGLGAVRPEVTFYGEGMSADFNLLKHGGRSLRCPNPPEALAGEATCMDEFIFTSYDLENRGVTLAKLDRIRISVGDADPAGAKAAVLVGIVRVFVQ
ncbi:MAG: hypothetical protein H6711_25005 [Myxococcales bacterium]|nr:hypothetical protein [Myxococcales bacterium]